MVETMATPRFVRSFHCGTHRVRLRMNIPLRGRKIAVPGQIRERVRVHIRRPPGQARVTEGVQIERLQFRKGDRFPVLLSQAGLFDMAGTSRCGEYPLF